MTCIPSVKLHFFDFSRVYITCKSTLSMEKDLLRSLDLLKENDEQVRNDAENVLLTVCQNILSHPNDKKFREVRLDHPLVTAKLLPALGAIECLFDIGFVEVIIRKNNSMDYKCYKF